VIDRKYGRPDIRRVAVFADVACLHVRRSFAGGLCAVMAAKAVACDVDMVEVRGQPTDGRMAIIAVVATGDMGWVFSTRRDTVMTRTAGTQHLRMVDCVRGRPNSAVVAVLANIAGLYVCRAFAGGFCAVMAADAVSRNTGVIEIRR